MFLAPPTRRWAHYLATAVASVAAIAVVATLQPSLGFLPMLLIVPIVLAHLWAGLGPAVVSAVLCLAGALLLMGRTPPLPELVHSRNSLIIFAAAAGAALYFLEALRRQKLLDRERLEEFSTLLESMPEAVLIFSPDGRIVDVNSAAVQFARVSRRQLIGASVTELTRRLAVLSDDSRPVEPAEMAVNKALRGETVRNERRAYVRKGERMEAVVSASPLRGAGGEIVGALVVVRDVTEVAQLQRRIADTERHLAIGQMAAGIAHDFNNVLDTISQAIAVMELRPEQTVEERRRLLKMVSKAVRTGAEIIARVREYIRGGTGEQSAVNVCQLMEDALDLTRPLWQRQGRVSVVSEMKPVPAVWANAADLRRVFANLIINAVQAMPEGGRLTLHCESRNGSVLAWVSDTGVGILPEQQSKIFLPYYSTKAQGTGLGLSTAQKIVLSQGGSMSFTSEPGRGTIFYVELPAMVSEPAKVA